MKKPNSTAEAFAASLMEIDRELDWEKLGKIYCHEGGETFFDEPKRAALSEAGLRFTGDVGKALGTLPSDSVGSSLYAGAAVAELAPILCESVVLRREVRILNQPGPEIDELNRCFEVVARRLEMDLPRWETTDSFSFERAGPFDLVWFVSLLTDPESFPALSDALYGRDDARDSGADEPVEKLRAQDLVRSVLERVTLPAVLTTSDDELSFFESECAARGWRLHVPESARVSETVGDAVRMCRIEAC